MVNLEALRGRAERAYERARLVRALRVAIVVVPLTVLCAALTHAHEPCTCLGAVALALAVGFRWRSREGARGVTLGLAHGIVTATVGVALAGLGRFCGPSPTACVVVCLAAGIASGAGVGALPGHGALSRARLVPASAMALSVGTMGAAWLGLPGSLASAAGILLGSALFLWRRR